ncbi:PREDICTED: bet1-like protein At4g14600 [Nicotiana attenuata]|uniref:bet1-like protein At4g14600 n=1 Tax=Nicotiana attenuata TaxID=49451 RepID=UPI0009053CC2|nr:PREDICTED: bet1-like protein At4g14600 [Nicotiana attenuata]XP_019263289.1 PREDICTED: bet1-like protein At4g14600 [Nicotiana attenuata]
MASSSHIQRWIGYEASRCSDELQLRIDPMHGDLDDEITGLRKQVKQLRNVAQEIESEAKFQNDFINQLQMTLIKAQVGVKNNMTHHIQGEVPWCMLFADDIVLIDETRGGVDGRLYGGRPWSLKVSS